MKTINKEIGVGYCGDRFEQTATGNRPRLGLSGRRLSLIAGALLALVGMIAWGWAGQNLIAQQPETAAPQEVDKDKGGDNSGKAADGKDKTDANGEAAKAEAGQKKDEKPITAVVGADLYTVTQGVIRRGTILIQDGKIKEIGQNLTVPEGATVIDAAGRIITPGFITLEMSGIGIDSSASERDADYKDSLNPFDRNIRLALGVGITTGCSQISTGGGQRGRRRAEDRFLGLEPDNPLAASEIDAKELDYGDAVSLCPCCGLPILSFEPIAATPPVTITARDHAVIKMSYGILDGMLLKEDAFYDVIPGSLSGALNQHSWRIQIKNTREYIQTLQDYEKAVKAAKEGDKPKAPRKNTTDELIALVKGETYLRTGANSAGDIRAMIDLAEELDYKLCLDGVVEGWLTSEELSAADVSVIITPRNRRDPERGEEGKSGSWVEMPRVFEEKGIPFGITALSASISLGGLAGRDLTSLPLEAAFAVRGGCSESKALEALTIVPARLLGLSDRIGSLEAGKDADLLILDGKPLDYRTYVETAIVNGNVVYKRAEDPVWPVFERK